MSNYHTSSLQSADIFVVMGSVYAEVARYDSAINAGQHEQANQAISRAKELLNFSQSSKKINSAQKIEIKQVGVLLAERAKQYKKSNLDDYLMPFAIAARLRQLK
ncbi:MAG: hypothetical protein M3P98_01090 [bacterium]|nr:hypothetical protein [bacterium]